MSISAISNAVSGAAHWIPTNYMKTVAITSLAIGSFSTLRRAWKLSSDKSLVSASNEAKIKLDALNGKLELLDISDAAALKEAIHHNDVCGTEDPKPLDQQLLKLSTAPHFKVAAAHVRTLREMAMRVVEEQGKYLADKKDKALAWMKTQDAYAEKVWHFLRPKEDVEAQTQAIQKLSRAMNTAKKAIEKKETTIATIKEQMTAVSLKFKAVSATFGGETEAKKAIRDHKIKVGDNQKTIGTWFAAKNPDDTFHADIYKLVSTEDDNDKGIVCQHQMAGTIRDVDENKVFDAVQQAVGALKAGDFLGAFDPAVKDSAVSTANLSIKEIEEYPDKTKRDFYRELKVCGVIALAILAANYLTPIALGPDHKFLRAMKWPA